MSPVQLSGYLRCANPHEADAVTTHLARHIELTRAEVGCLSFEVHPTADPLVWTVAERFADEDAFASHQARVAASEWGRATIGIARDYVIRSEP